MKMNLNDVEIGVSPLTGEVYVGKLNKDKSKWLHKVNITDQFLKVVDQRKKILKEISGSDERSSKRKLPHVPPEKREVLHEGVDRRKTKN